MEVIVNKSPLSVSDNATIADVLSTLEIPLEGTGVELNDTFVIPDKFSETNFSDGAIIEIVRFVGGG